MQKSPIIYVTHNERMPLIEFTVGEVLEPLEMHGYACTQQLFVSKILEVIIMKKKIIFALSVFVFALLAVTVSYLRYGKKVAENTSGTLDGKILVSRKYSKISKVIVIDSKKKSRKKEVSQWNYNAQTGELFVTEDLTDFSGLSDFTKLIFHIEGKPSEPAQFILWNLDKTCGPTAVFLNEKVAYENREYVIDDDILTLKIPSKEISSVVIAWHTSDGGISSISEMNQKQSDLYAELEGAWFTENAKKSIMAQTEYQALVFDEAGNPQIISKKISDEEKQKMLDEFPVNTYKFRKNPNMKKLSKEAGFKVNLPKKCGGYKIVSTLLIESCVKGEKSNSVEFSYDKTDFFSLDSICIDAKKFDDELNSDDAKIEFPITTENLDLKFPVKKQTCWAAGNEIPEKLCIYTWHNNGTLYTIQCDEKYAQSTEEFLKNLW